MTKHSSFKKVVRRHARETGQRYTEALADLEGVEERLFHQPSPERVLTHIRDHYGIDATAATKTSQHNDHVFRVDRNGGHPWIVRVYPPARPKAGAEGDAAILRFLERRDYPAERLPDGPEKIAMMGDLLGRLHTLELDDSVGRPGGAGGNDPHREGSPNQDLVAGLSFLDAVDTRVTAGSRHLLDQLREQVRSVDSGEGLPEALLHGNLLHNPDHALLTDDGPVAINWRAAGRGPRLADLAYLLWGAEWGDGAGVEAAVNAYRRHIELTEEELDRLEAVMYVRPLYLTCFDFRQSVASGEQPTGNEWWWGLINPDRISRNAAAARTAFSH